jgi:hypothetical protein
MEKRSDPEIDKVRQGLKDLSSLKDPDAAELILQRVSRSIQMLKRRFPAEKALSMLAVDLAELFRSEKELRRVQNHFKAPADGFFKSLAVIQEEFEKVLSALEGR